MASPYLSQEVLDALERIIEEAQGRSLNEADTRHRIIDFIIHDVLSWPRNRTANEEYILKGFADYVLKKADGEDLLFIEAKREGDYFEMPVSFDESEKSGFISIKKLMTDKSISSAMIQVRNYCMDTGCEYAAITNGHEWIFFKTFEKGKRWEQLQAFVVRGLRFFLDEYTKALNSFSYVSITERASLPGLLGSSFPRDRSIYYPKQKIPSYDHPINANRLASKLRPLVSRFFGVIEDSDTDFMNKCYISQRDYVSTYSGIQGIIQDALSPYFEGYGVQQLDDNEKGGRLGKKLTRVLKAPNKGEVIVLFGGKGSGKSTFIKRLLHHNPPRWLNEHAVTAIVDLLKVPEDKEVIRKYIWDRLVSLLDKNGLLALERDSLMRGLFKDEFALARRQNLAGLAEDSPEYNVALNSKLTEWKSDKKFCAKKLVNYWSEKNKGVIVVIDNTDQYSTDIQDFCFASAQEISKEIEGLVLISMREERFYNSKIHGLLDAFQNSGFHISSPRPTEVFKKRISYLVDLLKDHLLSQQYISDAPTGIKDECIRYLEILRKEFVSDSSPLNSFLTACAHGDIRLALDLFRSFVLSGYTNVDEMISAGAWTLQVHQVIKPIMIPNRYYYTEQLSDIPNMYQLRTKRHSSHFTALRILRKISNGNDVRTPAYYSVAELKAYFAETFNMLEDFEGNLDVLLRHGFVEANNRLDSYSDGVDSVTITNYGLYAVQDLAYEFTYLDLICTDCGVFNEEICNYLVEAANSEYRLFNSKERYNRVITRLERADHFLKYLEGEERRENELFSLGLKEEDMFSLRAIDRFRKSRDRIEASAKKQKH